MGRLLLRSSMRLIGLVDQLSVHILWQDGDHREGSQRRQSWTDQQIWLPGVSVSVVHRCRSLLLSFSICYLGIFGLEGAINCISAQTSHQRTTSEKRMKALLPKCPLFGGSTCKAFTELLDIQNDIFHCTVVAPFSPFACKLARVAVLFSCDSDAQKVPIAHAQIICKKCSLLLLVWLVGGTFRILLNQSSGGSWPQEGISTSLRWAKMMITSTSILHVIIMLMETGCSNKACYQEG